MATGNFTKMTIYRNRALAKCNLYNPYFAISYSERLKILSLDSLELRRKIIDFCTLFKIIKGFTLLDKNSFLEINTRNSRKHQFQIRASKKN